MTKTLSWILILIADPRPIGAVVVALLAETVGGWHLGPDKWSGIAEELTIFLGSLLLIKTLLKGLPARLRDGSWARSRRGSLGRRRGTREVAQDLLPDRRAGRLSGLTAAVKVAADIALGFRPVAWIVKRSRHPSSVRQVQAPRKSSRAP